MRRNAILLALIVTLLCGGTVGAAVFEAGDGTFMLDGKPFVVKAAELHYPRIPRPYWEHRIRMCKALGMNTICLYVFWNVHEATPDVYDFEGQNDLREFIRLCDANDMKVILRPGPYVCAEWEMGGLPWWLLRRRDIRLREGDPYFLERVGMFERQLAAQVEGLTVADGGPVIMVQVENEYGSYGIDREYLSAIRDMLRECYGPQMMMFQCDWASNFDLNGLDDLLWTVNFGTGADVDEQFARLRQMRPHTPLMCSEYWSGWFDKWGDNHETRPADEMISGIGEMLSKGISFSLYMTHGGTNWGHWAGANSPGYAPDVTSYDYDAPISESGRATPKYQALRELLTRYSDTPLPDVPADMPTVSVAPFELTEMAPLFANLPDGVVDTCIRPMEEYGQGFGSILYSTTLPPMGEGWLLTVTEPHDYAQIFVDGMYTGTLDRRKGEHEQTMPAVDAGARLDILVEAMGRINFGRAIKDYKGITDSVTVTDDGMSRSLSDWTVYSLHDSPDAYNRGEFLPVCSLVTDASGRLPRGVYRGVFNVDDPGDTFLCFEEWGKGLVYVNGYPLGRIWEIGPQQTLYMPGCWLREGLNDIVVLDILGPRSTRCEGLPAPILDRVVSAATESAQSTRPDLTSLQPVAEGRLVQGGGWQQIDFDRPASGRYLCVEAFDACDGGDIAAIAEIYLVDGSGALMTRESWTALYADSENTIDGNNMLSKVFDMQESTYWSTRAGDRYPHTIVIDLGESVSASALRCLPRVECGAPGSICGYRVYIVDSPYGQH